MIKVSDRDLGDQGPNLNSVTKAHWLALASQSASSLMCFTELLCDQNRTLDTTFGSWGGTEM